MRFKKYTLTFSVSCARRRTFVRHGEVNLPWTSQEKYLRLLLSMSSKEAVMPTLTTKQLPVLILQWRISGRHGLFSIILILSETLYPRRICCEKKISIKRGGSLERSEVVINSKKTQKLKYYKNSDVLSVHFHYGYWNVLVYHNISLHTDGNLSFNVCFA